MLCVCLLKNQRVILVHRKGNLTCDTHRLWGILGNLDVAILMAGPKPFGIHHGLESYEVASKLTKEQKALQYRQFDSS